MIYITEIRMGDDGDGHEHIAAVRWTKKDSAESGETTVEELIGWIESKEGFVHVRDRAGHDVAVGVVRPEGRRPYIRTYADEKFWRDDLLDLPRYKAPS